VPRLLSALLVVLALAACGESAEDEYKDGFRPINRQLLLLGQEVGDGLRGAGEMEDLALADEFEGYARRLGELRRRLEALEAPGSIERDHERLLTASGQVRTALSEVAVAAKRSDAAAARDAAIRLVQGSERLAEARRTLAESVRRL
jgi:hypothetical protein